MKNIWHGLKRKYFKFFTHNYLSECKKILKIIDKLFCIPITFNDHIEACFSNKEYIVYSFNY